MINIKQEIVKIKKMLRDAFTWSKQHPKQLYRYEKIAAVSIVGFLIILFIVWNFILNYTYVSQIPLKDGVYYLGGANKSVQVKIINISHLVFMRNGNKLTYPKHGEFIIVSFAVVNNSNTVYLYNSYGPVLTGSHTYYPYIFTTRAYIQPHDTLREYVEYDVSSNTTKDQLQLTWEKIFSQSGTTYDISI